MSPNNLTQPLGQSSPKTPLEVPTNPNSTIVDDINFKSQLLIAGIYRKASHSCILTLCLQFYCNLRFKKLISG